ncbi:hypothetical protein QMO14_17105 [Variovorax sp. CAN2819]|uniref:hypothetical protein n=1 Tax=Variovorax sp. CAN15 TaxID=3046727 RepID=UPI00264A4228|nr:hypothetical protein [Variovorax sp. CAN15]MDN6885327.1 hypothetical protein [Variovorax sp. CAN15]
MIFAPTNPDKIASQQLYEARRMLLEHRAAAEYHDTMARMYEARIARLSAEQPQKVTP